LPESVCGPKMSVSQGNRSTLTAVQRDLRVAMHLAGDKTLFSSPQDPYIGNRWPLAEAIYRSVGSIAAFGVYPGVAHSYSAEMLEDLQVFFAAHR
jgi:hypothetical protein